MPEGYVRELVWLSKPPWRVEYEDDFSPKEAAQVELPYSKFAAYKLFDC